MNLRRQAISFLRDSGSPNVSETLARLSQGESFLLPPGGLLMDLDAPFDCRLAECHLPFEKVVLEYDQAWLHLRGPNWKAEFQPNAALIVAEEDPEGFLIGVSWRYQRSGTPNWGPIGRNIGFSRSDTISVSPDGFIKASPRTAPAEPFTEEFSPPVADYAHELQVFAQFLLFANCENVSPVRASTVSAQLRKAAQRRGKVPFNDYWILDLGDQVDGDKQPLGGAHASPRLHIRRGHIRHLASGKTTFVRPHKVGRAEFGTVLKDYRIT